MMRMLEKGLNGSPKNLNDRYSDLGVGRDLRIGNDLKISVFEI